MHSPTGGNFMFEIFFNHAKSVVALWSQRLRGGGASRDPRPSALDNGSSLMLSKSARLDPAFEGAGSGENADSTPGVNALWPKPSAARAPRPGSGCIAGMGLRGQSRTRTRRIHHRPAAST